MYNNLLPAIGQILPGFVGYFLLIVILMKDAVELLHPFEPTQQEFFNILKKNFICNVNQPEQHNVIDRVPSCHHPYESIWETCTVP